MSDNAKRMFAPTELRLTATSKCPDCDTPELANINLISALRLLAESEAACKTCGGVGRIACEIYVDMLPQLAAVLAKAKQP